MYVAKVPNPREIILNRLNYLLKKMKKTNFDIPSFVGAATPEK